jgi:uncharacterized membrane protein YciS (DUF1049 family)
MPDTQNAKGKPMKKIKQAINSTLVGIMFIMYLAIGAVFDMIEWLRNKKK